MLEYVKQPVSHTNNVWLFLLFITFKSNMTTTKKIAKNLINENIIPLNVSSLEEHW